MKSAPDATTAAPALRPAGAWLSAAVVLCSLGLLLATAWLYVRVFAPERRAAAHAPVTAFDPSAMRAATTPEAVLAEQSELMALGSRYLGQPGMYAAAEHVEGVLGASGFEVFEQPIRSVAPRTAYRQILRLGAAGAEPLSDVEVYPFMPNHFQPVVTPPEGLDGELLLLDRATIESRHDFRDVIGVIEAAPGKVDDDYGYHFERYARLGVKALIVANREGLAAIDWQATMVPTTGTSALVSSVPINYVRLAATPGIFSHLGERVRLRVRVDFVEQPNRTLYGVLRAKRPANEAIVLYAPYDAASILPDLAPGALPALNTAFALQLARGLAGARSTLDRDVIVVSSGSSVMGEDGLSQLLRVLQFNTFASRSNRLLDAVQPLSRDVEQARAGAELALATRLEPVEQRAQQNAARQDVVAQALRSLDQPDFLSTSAGTERGLAALSPAARDFFNEQFQYVLGRIVFERQEPALAAKLRFERAGAVPNGPAFADYLTYRRQLDEASAVAGASPQVLLEQSRDFVESAHVKQLCRERFQELSSYHAARRQELAGDRRVAQLFSRYRDFAVFRPELAPAETADSGREVLSIYAKSARETQSVDLLLAQAARRVVPADAGFRVEPIATTPVDQNTIVEKNVLPAPVFHYWMTYAVGYQNQAWVNLGRQPSYQRWASPTTAPFMTELSSLRGSFAALGELSLYLGHGNGLLGSPQGYPWQRKSYGGQVLVSNVGQSVVPNFPLAHALLGARSVDQRELYSALGFWNNPFYMTDPYGRFDLPEEAANFPVWWRVYDDGNAYTPLAAGFGRDGLIAYMKDEGEEGQRLFKSKAIPMSNEALVKNTTIVTFRAAPVSILDLTNPQDFKDYKAVELLTADGLLPFSKRCQYLGVGFITTFVPPDKRASVLLKTGRPDNEHVSEVRAFMLNTPDGTAQTGVSGAGYLPADHPLLLDVPLEAARSMTRVNGQRLALQNQYRMADERTNQYHQKALSLLKQAQAPLLSAKLSAQRARDAVSYAELNHPVLRESVFEAVIGILWYLGLLVPFVYFAEKLVFCFADIRRQLAAQVVIFLSVFGLLRLLHPAFQMVRSSLMILLGFVIVLVSAGITLMFSSAAKENLADLRKRQGKVAGAEVNGLSVLSTSFLVGLNNMHRRRVRTGLTCATLTLLTFVMICFASTQNELVDEVTTLGRADYQGLLARHDDFLAMTDSELFALKSKFAERFVVAERRFYIGQQEWQERKRYNPSLTAGFPGKSGLRRAGFSSLLKLSAEEPLRRRIQLLAGHGWFLPGQERDDGQPCPVLLPDKLAERLGIEPEQVEKGEVTVTINGVPFRVWSIFSSESLDTLRDMDGLDLLPFDIERVSTLGETAQKGVTASTDEPRIPASQIVITPLRDLKLAIPNGNEVIASVAVDMGKVGLREAKQEIEAHLEKTAQPAFYGLDGVAYRGLRTRQLTLAGLLELLVPLLIAGLTVLNTMKGSVYERRSELYVYNAVGIAPRYVVAMFLAEAFVYVVVGSVLGYLLSQGVGRVLSGLGMTGGLNMTFTSIATIYASLGIAAAVFVSTWFPARSAMEIASPAEESGWKLPEPSGDLLIFDLPFNFGWRDRVAVLAFFERWLLEHGEGSAGRFFAEPPRIGVASEPDAARGGVVPEMQSAIWLKPLDLGVCQELRISTPFDAETEQFKARLELERRAGTREAWLRLNHSFVAALRRHFLHWRAVSDVEREEMFELAKQRLQGEQAGGAPESPGVSA